MLEWVLIDLRKVFHLSYDRVVSNRINGETFFTFFYKTFPNSDPVLKKKFENTDLESLARMVHNSIHLMVRFSEDYTSNSEIGKVALIHRKERLDIHPRLYPIWLNSILMAVSLFDPKYSDEVALAWKLAMAPGITFLTHFYEKDLESSILENKS